jgi:hypothetical protein
MYEWWIKKEAVVAWFKVVSQHFLGGTEKKYLRYSISELAEN